MAPALSPRLTALLRPAAKTPVTCAIVAAMAFTAALTAITEVDIFFLDSGLDFFYPWCFVTYPISTRFSMHWMSPLNLAVALWGATAETATGSSEYAAFLLFTTIATGVLVLLAEASLVCVRYVFGISSTRWYGYLGIWPVAEVIAFSLCRARGGTVTALPRVRVSRLTLQQTPLAFVWLALGLDIVDWVFNVFVDHSYDTPRWLGSSALVAAIAFLVSWRYERHVAGAGNAAFALDAFIYPAPLRERVRLAATRASDKLRHTPLRALLPTEGGAGGRPAGSMPMPVFSGGAAGAAYPEGGVAVAPALLPGTTAEEAERHRLIAREALARRLQQLQQESARVASPAAEAAESEAKTA